MCQITSPTKLPSCAPSAISNVELHCIGFLFLTPVPRDPVLFDSPFRSLRALILRPSPAIPCHVHLRSALAEQSPTRRQLNMCPRATVPTGRASVGARAQRGVTQLEYGGLRVSFVTFASRDSASTFELYGEASETNVGARPFFRALPIPTSNVAALSSWASARPSARFGISCLRRLGFTEDLKAANNNCKSRSHKVLEAHRGGGRVRKLRDEGTKESTYEIRRVSFRSGRDQRFSGRCGSGFFASDLLRRGPDTFWPIAFHTIETHCLGRDSTLDAELGSAIDSDLEIVPGRIGKQGCSVELVYNPRRQAAFFDELDGWCQSHPDRFYSLSCPEIAGLLRMPPLCTAACQCSQDQIMGNDFEHH